MPSERHKRNVTMNDNDISVRANFAPSIATPNECNCNADGDLRQADGHPISISNSSPGFNP